MVNIMHVAILVACHNRKSVTVEGLGSLLSELKSVPEVKAQTFLVDDGSSDGTAGEVRRRFPCVRVLTGTGNLFWNGGMCLAYSVAHKVQQFDAYLLFNDDGKLYEGRLSGFFDSYRAANVAQPTIVVGAMTSRSGECVTYSGLRRTSKYRMLAFEQVGTEDASRVCDTFNANFVLVPGPFFESIGGLDPHFRHGLGDIDLGLVARALGLDVVMHKSPVGVCERGVTVSERVSLGSLKERWQLLFSGPTGIRPYLYFAWKHGRRYLYPLYVAHAVLSRCWLMLGKRVGSAEPRAES